MCQRDYAKENGILRRKFKRRFSKEKNLTRERKEERKKGS